MREVIKVSLIQMSGGRQCAKKRHLVYVSTVKYNGPGYELYSTLSARGIHSIYMELALCLW
jgi:hypothetical protein